MIRIGSEYVDDLGKAQKQAGLSLWAMRLALVLLLVAEGLNLTAGESMTDAVQWMRWGVAILLITAVNCKTRETGILYSLLRTAFASQAAKSAGAENGETTRG